MPDSPPEAAFYFDLASPLAYFAAEQVLQALPQPLPWYPVLAGGLPDGHRSEGWRHAQDGEISRSALERRALELGLAPVRWPSPFPFDSDLAMRVATYAKGIGRVVPFALAAFRQAFAGGHALDQSDHVLIAAAACEMHPRAVLAAAQRQSIAGELRETTAQAAAAGVTEVPAIRVGHQVFIGARALQDAALLTGAR
jgi:2-hydroxychromene-2-carboxylate isomerase